MESTIIIPTFLVVIATILIILILIAVVVFVVTLVKVVIDIRKVTQNLTELSKEIREQPLLELLKDGRLRKNIIGDFKTNFIRILPFLASILAFLGTRKSKKKNK